MTRDLVADVSDNLRTVFKRLAENVSGGEVRQFGSITGASSGLPLPIYNRAFVFDPPDEEEVARVVEWLTERDVPFWVTANESVASSVGDIAGDLDLVMADRSDPGMALASLTMVPLDGSVTDIREVSGTTDLDDFSSVAATVFETQENIADQVYQAAWAAEDTRLFLGRVERQPVACGMLAQTDDVAGIYTMAVIDAFRRQGIGESMALELLRTGREAGCRVGALQSSDMALPLYEQIGFERVTTYHHFEPAP